MRALPKLIVFLKDIAWGGIIFWIPAILLTLTLRDWRLNTIVSTFVLPLITIAGLIFTYRYRLARASYTSIAFPMLLGIWLAGPLFMAINSDLYSQGITNHEIWQFIWNGITWFPMFTYMMSGYHGTLFALLFVTICLILVPVVERMLFRKRLS